MLRTDRLSVAAISSVRTTPNKKYSAKVTVLARLSWPWCHDRLACTDAIAGGSDQAEA